MYGYYFKFILFRLDSRRVGPDLVGLSENHVTSSSCPKL